MVPGPRSMRDSPAPAKHRSQSKHTAEHFSKKSRHRRGYGELEGCERDKCEGLSVCVRRDCVRADAIDQFEHVCVRVRLSD